MAEITALTVVIMPLARQILLFLRNRPVVQHNTDMVKPVIIVTRAKGTISCENFAIIDSTSPYIERIAAMTLKIITTIGTIFFITIL